YEMNHGVRRATQGKNRSNRVVEGCVTQYVTRLQVLPDHFNNSAAGAISHLGVIGIDRGYRGRTGEGETKHFAQASHGGGGAHGHARSSGAGDPILDFGPGS